MVDYNSLKTEEERKFATYYGEFNCCFKTLRGLKEIKKIIEDNLHFYRFSQEYGTKKDFFEVVGRFANKKVLVEFVEGSFGNVNNNFICGDDNWVFLDEMFVDNKF